QAPRVQVAALGERDEPLRERPQLLRLGGGGGDPPVAEQAGGHVAKQGLAVAGRAAELPALLTVSHDRCSFCSGRSGLVLRVRPRGVVLLAVRLPVPPERPVVALLEADAEAQPLGR